MRDLGLNRLLTLGTASALLIGTQACSDDAAGRTSRKKIAQLKCDGLTSCTTFGLDDFDTMEDCLENYEEFYEEYEEYLEEEYGGCLTEAYLGYFECSLEEYEDSCREPSAICEREFAIASRSCD